MFNVKVGYRSPFAKLDTLEMKFQTPVTNLRRSYFNFDLQWSNPHLKYGNFFNKLSYTSESLFKPIDEKSYLLNFGTDVPEKNIQIEWENRFRNPIIQERFDEYILKNYHLSSFKSSIKATKIWKNTIEFNDINMGEYL